MTLLICTKLYVITDIFPGLKDILWGHFLLPENPLSGGLLGEVGGPNFPFSLPFNPRSHSLFIGSHLSALFRLQNIMHCCESFFYFFCFPLFPKGNEEGCVIFLYLPCFPAPLFPLLDFSQVSVSLSPCLPIPLGSCPPCNDTLTF